jgi:hypothetical protein
MKATGTSVTIPRESLTRIRDTTNIRFKFETMGSYGRKQKRETTAFRVAVIPLKDSEPTVDADLREYRRAPKMVLGEQQQVSHGVFAGKDDISAVVAALWTPRGIYVGADITDDMAMMNDRGVGEEIYKGDLVELYIGPSGYDGQYYVDSKAGDRHFALSPGKNGVGCVVSDFEKEVAGSKIAVKRRKGGYIMEAFIPKSALGGYVPEQGDIIAWDVQVNDRDDYSSDTEVDALMWNGDRMNWLRAGKWGLAVVR